MDIKYIGDSYEQFDGKYGATFTINEIDKCFHEAKYMAYDVEDEIAIVYKAFLMNLGILYSNKKESEDDN